MHTFITYLDIKFYLAALEQNHSVARLSYILKIMTGYNDRPALLLLCFDQISKLSLRGWIQMSKRLVQEQVLGVSCQ